MLIYSSFGSNSYYTELAENSFSEFKKIYPNSEKIIFTKSDLPQRYQEFAEKNSRGFGYWWWLSYLYKKLVEDINANDIIFWSDARSGFKKNKFDNISRKLFKIQWLENFINTPLMDICAWQMDNHKEYEWTTADVLNEFDISYNSKNASSGQFTNHFLTFRKNKNTKLFFEEFYKFSIEKKHLWLPKEYNLKNHSKFHEPRWLQSILSLMLKRNKQMLKIMKTSNKEIYRKGSIHPQIYKHHPEYKF